ncbi:MAG: hypothetical protein M3321_07970 [Actinomycetota bacterium]|nr:hypothetical protein [Actinomycetota bacterium]
MQPPRFDPIRALKTLAAHEVRFVVVGAFAAVVQGYPLPTYDLDVTPERQRDNVERLVRALVELNARLRVPAPESVAFPIDVRMLEGADVWTLLTDAGPLDLLTTPAGTHGYDDLRRDAVELELDGVPFVFASLRDVIRMKEASNRPKDVAQLPALRQTLELVREREARDRRR